MKKNHLKTNSKIHKDQWKEKCQNCKRQKEIIVNQKMPNVKRYHKSDYKIQVGRTPRNYKRQQMD